MPSSINYAVTDFPDTVQVCSKNELVKYLSQLKNHLILISTAVLEHYFAAEDVAAIKKENGIYPLSCANPTINDVLTTYQELKAIPRHIVAIGGGSVIDVAKALSYLAPYPTKSLTYEQVETYLKSPLIKELVTITAVPTTAGTGSEATKWATIWDDRKQTKLSINYVCPQKVLLVPELTSKLPLRITLSTACDALSHATEAYWAKSSNEGVRGYAMAAIKLIIKALKNSKSGKFREAERQDLLFGSFLAGVAFAQTATTLSHSISYPLTARYHLDHGFAVALSLAEVFRFNYDYFDNPEGLLNSYGVSNVDQLKALLKAVTAPVVDLSLRGFGLAPDDVAFLAPLAIDGARSQNNPRPIDVSQVQAILTKCL